MKKPSAEQQHLQDIEWFKGKDKRQYMTDRFKSLAEPGNIEVEDLRNFLLEIPYDAFGGFANIKMVARQNVYSPQDLAQLSNIISQVATMCYLNINKAFERRVNALDKETALHSHARAFNCWQILKNALAEPVQLRGSSVKEENYTLFMIENEEFEEINYGNLG